jgi:hypothetical protein
MVEAETHIMVEVLILVGLLITAAPLLLDTLKVVTLVITTRLTLHQDLVDQGHTIMATEDLMEDLDLWL